MKKIWLHPFILLTGMLMFSAPAVSQEPAEPTQSMDAKDRLIAKGRKLFFKATFDGNGRTCGTCHRAENNLTIDPEFIATLSDDDPLFVAEYVPELMQNFENPKLMREFGLIMVNSDGFDNPANKFTMRSVPHVFAQNVSISSPQGPHLGWSGDGAPGNGSLRSFATGAVMQHFTKTTLRRKGVDFRLPTAKELDALEAFMLSLGRQEDLVLPLALKSEAALEGQDLFQNEGQCSSCHVNAGANNALSDSGPGNLNFNTGVENLPDQPAVLSGEIYSPDDGAGTPGNGEFNTPSLVEAADTPPFFHNNSVKTIEDAIAFYNSDAFATSPGALKVNFESLDKYQVAAIGAFLRVINTLHNIREVNAMLNAVVNNETLAGEHPKSLARRAVFDIQDAITVLSDGALHPAAITYLKQARVLTNKAVREPENRVMHASKAIKKMNKAKSELIE